MWLDGWRQEIVTKWPNVASLGHVIKNAPFLNATKTERVSFVSYLRRGIMKLRTGASLWPKDELYREGNKKTEQTTKRQDMMCLVFPRSLLLPCSNPL